MQRSRFHRPGLLLTAALGLAVSACTDRANPVAPDPGGGTGTPGTPVTVAALACSANRASLTVSCQPPRQSIAGAPDIIVGGQHVFVTATSSTVSYNSGTGQFKFDLTLTNLIEQKMGTTDGVSLDPNGIRVFFSSGPNVTSGTGVASVVPDGFGTFTAAGQPYYQYNQVIANGQTTAAKQWTLVMPPTVTTFDFVLLLSAPVQFPNGYVTLNGNLPGASYGNLVPGTTAPLTAVVKNALGIALVGQTVSFSTTNPTCATVDGGGTVTGVQYATCTINALSSGGLPGSLSFDVLGARRYWNGSVSTNWATGGNWDGGLAPATADSAVIPTGKPLYPTLTANVNVAGIDVASGATVNLSTFDLTLTRDALTSGTTAGDGAISGTTGLLVLSGTGSVKGTIGLMKVTGTYALSGDVLSTAPAWVLGGLLSSAGYLTTVK